MKEYIDLTQLPASEIDRMVAELNCNDIEGLRHFFERLGLLYGYPLEEVVNVFSDYLMLDKHHLRCAFEKFSHKHAVELLQKFLDFLSADTTPLSVTEDLSLDLEWVKNDVSALQEDLSSLSANFDDLSTDVYDKLQDQDDKISSLIDLVQLSSIAGIRYNGDLLSADENRIVDLPDIGSDLSIYFKGYIDGIIGDASFDAFKLKLKEVLTENGIYKAYDLPDSASLTCVIRRLNAVTNTLNGLADYNG